MCHRCFRDGKECEGYERWATFVNRTPSGLQKRHHLEEAIIPGTPVSDPTTSLPSPRPPLPPTCMLHPSNPDHGLLSRYLDWYLPKPSARDVEGYVSVLVCELPAPLPVLRAAMRALAASCVGLYEGNEALKAMSLESYTEATNLLSQSLRLLEPINYEQITAASTLMMSYETYKTTGSSAGAWESHLRGLIEMMLRQGPRAQRSPLGKSLLMDIKFSSVSWP